MLTCALFVSSHSIPNGKSIAIIGDLFINLVVFVEDLLAGSVQGKKLTIKGLVIFAS
jgi:hypothetical protein